MPPRAQGRRTWRSRRLSGVIALSLLGGVGLAGAMATSLMTVEQREDAPVPSGARLSQDLAGPMQAEPATLGGMGRVLATLQQDIGAWQRLMASDLGFAAGAPRAGAEAPLAVAAQDGNAARQGARRSPAGHALTALAVSFATVTLLAGLAALLLERLLLAPFRALRAAAQAISDGDFGSAVPGTERDDEAGALARTLERFRISELARQSVDHESLDSAGLVGAGAVIEASARRIERVAGDASALALECCLAVQGNPAADAGCQAVAQSVRALSIQVVTLREAGRDASAAMRDIVEAVGALDAVADAAGDSGVIPADRRLEQVRSMAAAF